MEPVAPVTVAQGVLDNTGAPGRPYVSGVPHALATRANTLYHLDHNMHGNVRENCAAACVSKSSGYRWLAQLRDKGRKSARQTGGREP
eukprot:463587-Prorocentrum_minimum.AAC.1